MLEGTNASALFRSSRATFDEERLANMDWTNVANMSYMFAGWNYNDKTELNFSNLYLPNLERCDKMFGSYPNGTTK